MNRILRPRLLDDARAAAARARAFIPVGEKMGVGPLVHELLVETGRGECDLGRALANAYPEASRIHPCDMKRLPDEAVSAALATAGDLPLAGDALLLALLQEPQCRAALSGWVHEEHVRAFAATLASEYDPESSLRQWLARHIAGQAEALRSVSRALACGLSSYRDTGRPRGVMVFAGTTGVGKTETATLIAKLLGGPLIRFDCNMLGGGANGDPTPMLWQIFGTGAGFKGMDNPSPFAELENRPDAVVLFDEFEKAHSHLGQLLLQALDTGVIRDPQRRTIDLRRCFIILTSNAGVEVRPSGGIGFGDGNVTAGSVTIKSIQKDLFDKGHRPEFIGRIPSWTIFKKLEAPALDEALKIHLEVIRKDFAARGVTLTFHDDATSLLAKRIGAEFGLRPALAKLHQDISRKLLRLSAGMNRTAEPVTLSIGSDFFTAEPEDEPAPRRTTSRELLA